MVEYVCKPHRNHVVLNDAKGGAVKLAIATYDNGMLWSLAFVKRLPDGEAMLVDLRHLPVDRETLDNILWLAPLLGIPAMMDVAQRIDLVELAESQRDRMGIYEKKGES